MRLIDADAFKNYIQEGWEATKHEFKHAYRELAEAITQSFLDDIDEQPTVDEWTSVKKGLPDREGFYTVTVKGPVRLQDESGRTYRDVVVDNVYYSMGKGFLTLRGMTVLAWREQIRPYEPKEES